MKFTSTGIFFLLSSLFSAAQDLSGSWEYEDTQSAMLEFWVPKDFTKQLFLKKSGANTYTYIFRYRENSGSQAGVKRMIEKKDELITEGIAVLKGNQLQLTDVKVLFNSDDFTSCLLRTGTLDLTQQNQLTGTFINRCNGASMQVEKMNKISDNISKTYEKKLETYEELKTIDPAKEADYYRTLAFKDLTGVWHGQYVYSAKERMNGNPANTGYQYTMYLAKENDRLYKGFAMIKEQNRSVAAALGKDPEWATSVQLMITEDGIITILEKEYLKELDSRSQRPLKSWKLNIGTSKNEKVGLKGYDTATSLSTGLLLEKKSDLLDSEALNTMRMISW